MAQQVLTVVNQSFVNVSDDGQDINLPGNAGSATQTLDHTHQAPSGQCGSFPTMYQSTNSLRIQGPGRNFGNAGGWSLGSSDATLECAVSQRGIHSHKGFEIKKHAVGDTAGIYGYVWSDGGIHGQSDEGVTSMTLELNEFPGYFHGQVVSSSGKGDIKPVFKFVSGNAWTTDGAFMLNISKATIACNILSPSQPLYLNATAAINEKTFLNYLPVTAGSLPISEAIGICDAAIPVNQFTADAPQPVTITVRLAKIGGVAKPFTVGSYVTVAGNWFPEQAKLNSVVTNADGTQTLTMNLRNPNGQAIVFQGPVAGTYMSFGANLRFSGMRSTWFALGSTTGSDLIYAVQCAGSVEPDFTLPMIGNEAATNDGGPNSDVLLVPGAEVVCNNDQGFDCVLEQNNVLWEPGDLVENPHYPIFGGTALWITKQQNSPSSPRHGTGGLTVQVGGTGFGGGNTAALRVQNTNPRSMYQADGGPLVAPGGVEISGPFRNVVYSEYGPQGGGAVVYVQKRAGTNPSTPVPFGIIDDAIGGNLIFLPAAAEGTAGTWRFDGPVDAPSFTKNGGPLTVGESGDFSIAGVTVTFKDGLFVGVK